MENKKSKEKRSKFIIDKDLCAGCGVCIQACPAGAIHMNEDGKFSINQDKCVDCADCANICPFDAIIKVDE